MNLSNGFYQRRKRKKGKRITEFNIKANKYSENKTNLRNDINKIVLLTDINYRKEPVEICIQGGS